MEKDEKKRIKNGKRKSGGKLLLDRNYIFLLSYSNNFITHLFNGIYGLHC